MLASFLHTLFANCKSLEKTGEYHFDAIENAFISEVNDFVHFNSFQNEQELIAKLKSERYGNISGLLDRSRLIKIFYLVNSLGEYNPPPCSLDELERFKFSGSVQEKIGITDNVVLALIRESTETYPFLKSSFKVTHHKSYFFLSHDIDSIYGSLLQDGLWALKKGRFDVLFKLFVNVVIAKPHWFNMDLIMKLESEYDFRSTFFWLVNKGKLDQRQTNSDYDIKSVSLRETLKKTGSNGFENGLHKSISSDSFKTELDKLPVSVGSNRHHYLKFSIPELYSNIEEVKLKMDASLGFAEHYGFRNSYGYPFSPYNFKTGTHYSFLEVPLNVMDGTFQRYMKIPVDQTATLIIDFLEKNKNDSLISILWHNTFFTDYKYKGYKEEYLKILSYLHEQKFTNMNQSEIINLFSWKK